MRAALLQLMSSDDPKENLWVTSEFVRNAASEGAGLKLTPEVTSGVYNSRTHQSEVLQSGAEDLILQGLREGFERFARRVALGRSPFGCRPGIWSSHG